MYIDICMYTCIPQVTWKGDLMEGFGFQASVFRSWDLGIRMVQAPPEVVGNSAAKSQPGLQVLSRGRRSTSKPTDDRNYSG